MGIICLFLHIKYIIYVAETKLGGINKMTLLLFFIGIVLVVNVVFCLSLILLKEKIQLILGLGC